METQWIESDSPFAEGLRWRKLNDNGRIVTTEVDSKNGLCISWTFIDWPGVKPTLSFPDKTVRGDTGCPVFDF